MVLLSSHNQDNLAKSPSERVCHSESRDYAGRRISFFHQVPRSLMEFTLSRKARSFAEFTLSRKARSFALLRMTRGEGLRMTSSRRAQDDTSGLLRDHQAWYFVIFVPQRSYVNTSKTVFWMYKICIYVLRRLLIERA
jgi:hypothetical protein